MTTLFITRGLPASGKSTWARAWVSEDPQRRAEVNRDHLRIMMHGGYVDQETQITAAAHATIRTLLERGVSVVSSDTNLPQRHARELASIGRRAGAKVEIVDLSDVPLDVCLARNATRGDAYVPADRIREMHRRYIAPLKGKPFPLPTEDPAKADSDFVEVIPGLPWAVLVDIDGTLALKGDRHPHDLSRVHEDRPNEPVIEVVRALHHMRNFIVFMSGRNEGRDGEVRHATEQWLFDHLEFAGGSYLYMRKYGDNRKDAIVKRELFDTHIRGIFNVRAVLDDRDQVVRMWRDELGLTCLQVADGAF